MKTLSVTATVALAFVLMSASYESTTQGRIASKKSGCQHGMGICILKDSPSMSYPIHFQFDTGTDVLTLDMLEKDLQKVQPLLYDEFMGQSSFLLEEDLPLPTDLVQALMLSRNFIARGAYPIRHKDEKIIICFTL